MHPQHKLEGVFSSSFPCANLKFKAWLQSEQSHNKASAFSLSCLQLFYGSSLGAVTSKSQHNAAQCFAVLVKQKLYLNEYVWKCGKQKHLHRQYLIGSQETHLSVISELSKPFPAISQQSSQQGGGMGGSVFCLFVERVLECSLENPITWLERQCGALDIGNRMSFSFFPSLSLKGYCSSWQF